MATETAAGTSGQLFEALKSLAEAGAVFTVVAFVAGWSFMAAYYSAFGINPLELDFSVAVTATFAVHMVKNSGWLLAIASLVLVLPTVSRKPAALVTPARTGVYVLLL